MPRRRRNVDHSERRSHRTVQPLPNCDNDPYYQPVCDLREALSPVNDLDFAINTFLKYNLIEHTCKSTSFGFNYRKEEICSYECEYSRLLNSLIVHLLADSRIWQRSRSYDFAERLGMDEVIIIARKNLRENKPELACLILRSNNLCPKFVKECFDADIIDRATDYSPWIRRYKGTCVIDSIINRLLRIEDISTLCLRKVLAELSRYLLSKDTTLIIPLYIRLYQLGGVCDRIPNSYVPFLIQKGLFPSTEIKMIDKDSLKGMINNYNWYPSHHWQIRDHIRMCGIIKTLRMCMSITEFFDIPFELFSMIVTVYIHNELITFYKL